MSARIAWVTGASRGIGRAIALRLAAAGHVVAVGYHEHAESAEEVVAQIRRTGGTAAAVGGDLGTEEGVRAAHEDIVATLGAVEILVANHGSYARAPFEALAPDDWRRALDVNLTGPFLLTRRVLPPMRHNGWGRLVYMGSIRGRTGSGHGAHYAAAKAGLLGLARSVALEAGQHGITANLVAPGMIDTDLLGDWDEAKRQKKAAEVPVRRLGLPEDVAAAVAWLASAEASYVNGIELPVDGHWLG